MLNSDDLRFFHVIASHGTLASAARALDITPPSVTQRLQALERRIGVKLIHRPSRSISLTDEGALIYSRSARILNEFSELQSLIDDRRRVVSGKLRVLAPLGFGNDYVSPLLGRYAITHPHMEVELTLSDAPNWAKFHQWDIVIYIGELKDSSMSCIKLASNRRFLCASGDYLSRKGIPATPSDLQRHDCIALRENSEDVTLWRLSCQGKDCSVRIHPRLASNEGRVVRDWALSGHGIIMRSEWDIQPFLSTGQLVKVLPDYVLPDADIVALTGNDFRSRSPRTQMFIDMLKDALSSRPWRAL
ncbi:LysR family transcriptional regulator [Salmonella enterica]|nr:LysR family transcriptional regulator [Salmonella enterica]